MTKCAALLLLALSTLCAGEPNYSDQCWKPTGCNVPYVAAMAPDVKPPFPEPKTDPKGNTSYGDLIPDTEATEIEGQQNPGHIVAEWRAKDKRLKALGVLKCRWNAVAKEINIKAGGVPNGSKEGKGRYLPGKRCALFQVSVRNRPGWGNLPGFTEYRWAKSGPIIDEDCYPEPPL